jgi:hypothetical protein
LSTVKIVLPCLSVGTGRLARRDAPGNGWGLPFAAARRTESGGGLPLAEANRSRVAAFVLATSRNVYGLRVAAELACGLSQR